MRAVSVLTICALLVALVSGARVRTQFHLKRAVAESEIEAEFVKRTTPGSAQFREHLTVPQLVSLVQAPAARVASVLAFVEGLKGASDVSVNPTRDMISAVVESNSDAAVALGLKQQHFRPSNVRGKGAIPARLRGDVSLLVTVPPMDHKIKRGPKATRAQAQAGFPGMSQDPNTISARYNIPQTDVPAGSVQGVGEFQQSYFTQNDITTFSQRYNLTVPTIHVSGPNSMSTDDIEGTLDLEYITALAGGVKTWWISQNSTSSDPFGIDFTWWSGQVLSISPHPTVVSLSWGIGENNYLGKADILDQDNAAFRNLGLLGISVFAASGDTGPGSRGYLSCSKFDPSWPASSSYVTSVGATYSTTASSNEASVSFSGGGFSNYFGTPSWQQSAVSNYLSTASNLPKASFYNASGRAFPDVAALGTNFMIYAPGPYGGSAWQPVSGTSCASPTFAAVISRVNAARKAAGKATLGFLNPTLYSMQGGVGFDVTEGLSEDPDCFGFDIHGFPAASGWDAISGLGTPNYQHLHSQLTAQK